MYTGLRQLQVQSLPFLGKWSYCFPFAFFAGFVGIEVLALKASGHWTSVRTDLVVSCAGLVTIIGILAAFFASLFNRLEGLFHQISLIHLMEREEVEDLEDNHNQLLDVLKQQGDFCKRMSHYYPLVLLVVFIMAELVFLTAAGYMEAIEDKLAKYAFYGTTLVAFIITFFLTTFLRIEGMFTDFCHLAEASLKDLEVFVKNLNNKLKRKTQAKLKECGAVCF
mmetsp:Transcript_1388/g.2408  ORF Transcript_1388/g.2408 Transcript_1388/m.2408 type:complete len:223 (-) Transcript_1388:146-814(-)